MFIVFPKFGKRYSTKSAATVMGTELTKDAPTQPIFISIDDEGHARKVADYLAKENPGVDILLARVQYIYEVSPGKIKVKEVKPNGEILPA